MSEQDSSRKTLSIKPRAKSDTATSETKNRVRSGARARQVAQQSRIKSSSEQTTAVKETSSRLADKSAVKRHAGTESRNRTDSRNTSSDRRLTRQPSERKPSSKDLDPKRTRSSKKEAPVVPPLHSMNYDPEITGSSWDDLLEDETDTQDIEVVQDNESEDQPAERPEPDRFRRQARTTRVIHDAEIFPIFAPCPVGLEEALAAELVALGYQNVHTTRAGCHFEADWWGIQRANLYSRLATRILVQLGQAPVVREDDILELAHSIEWERWFGPEHTLRVDTSAVKSPMQSLQYCNLRAKDGICDRLREIEGARPSINTVRPDARVHLFLSKDTATLYLDTSGESLFKRGWRLDKGEAPLRENLAAGMLALSGWDPNAALLDPFCGSGTILIEAAWIALGVPPGMIRPFGFERLRDHQARRWADLKEEAQEHILPGLEAPLVGVDINPEAIEAAQRNAERAFLEPDTIHFEIGDAREVKAPAPTGWIVTNPPYGERLEEWDPEFWREWSANLKREFAGWQVNAITSDLDLPKHLRLKANRRTPLFNGALDCRLFNFELVEKSYRDK